MNGKSTSMMKSTSDSNATQNPDFTGFDGVQGTSIQVKDVLFNVLDPNETRLLVDKSEFGKVMCGEIELSKSLIKSNNLVVLGNFDKSPEIYP